MFNQLYYALLESQEAKQKVFEDQIQIAILQAKAERAHPIVRLVNQGLRGIVRSVNATWHGGWRRLPPMPDRLSPANEDREIKC